MIRRVGLFPLFKTAPFVYGPGVFDLRRGVRGANYFSVGWRLQLPLPAFQPASIMEMAIRQPLALPSSPAPELCRADRIRKGQLLLSGSHPLTCAHSIVIVWDLGAPEPATHCHGILGFTRSYCGVFAQDGRSGSACSNAA